eukprot:COSAG01_NODE_842_length_13174_cov_44.463250_19_plen_107_part_00
MLLGQFLTDSTFREGCVKCNVVTKFDDTTLPMYSTTRLCSCPAQLLDLTGVKRAHVCRLWFIHTTYMYSLGVELKVVDVGHDIAIEVSGTYFFTLLVDIAVGCTLP